MNLDTAQRSGHATALRRESAEANQPACTVFFEGIEVEAFWSDSKWHVRAAGHEAINPHLGEATRILFKPSLHADTASLIQEILASAKVEPCDPPTGSLPLG